MRVISNRVIKLLIEFLLCCGKGGNNNARMALFKNETLAGANIKNTLPIICNKSARDEICGGMRIDKMANNALSKLPARCAHALREVNDII